MTLDEANFHVSVPIAFTNDVSSSSFIHCIDNATVVADILLVHAVTVGKMHRVGAKGGREDGHGWLSAEWASLPWTKQKLAENGTEVKQGPRGPALPSSPLVANAREHFANVEAGITKLV